MRSRARSRPTPLLLEVRCSTPPIQCIASLAWYAVKAPLERERLRYTRERCSLTATLMLDHESAEGDEALCSTIVDAPVKRVGLSVEVQAQMKALSKLARKGGRALRELASTLDEWQDAGTISAAQRVDIEAALAAPER